MKIGSCLTRYSKPERHVVDLRSPVGRLFDSDMIDMSISHCGRVKMFHGARYNMATFRSRVVVKYKNHQVLLWHAKKRILSGRRTNHES